MLAMGTAVANERTFLLAANASELVFGFALFLRSPNFIVDKKIGHCLPIRFKVQIAVTHSITRYRLRSETMAIIGRILGVIALLMSFFVTGLLVTGLQIPLPSWLTANSGALLGMSLVLYQFTLSPIFMYFFFYSIRKRIKLTRIIVIDFAVYFASLFGPFIGVPVLVLIPNVLTLVLGFALASKKDMASKSQLLASPCG